MSIQNMKQLIFITKTILLITTFCLVFTFNSCNNDNEIDPKILNLYKEILIARETNLDNNLANQEVANIFKKYKMTEKEFRFEMQSMSKDNDKFMKLIDSVRNSIQISLDSNNIK